MSGRIAHHWRRWRCARRGHVWVMPPSTYHYEDCVHLPCRRCDAWRTVHSTQCPHGFADRTTMKGIT